MIQKETLSIVHTRTCIEPITMNQPSIVVGASVRVDVVGAGVVVVSIVEVGVVVVSVVEVGMERPIHCSECRSTRPPIAERLIEMFVADPLYKL